MLRKRGFTLIELLVVVAIIALLIAILIPALSRARDNARGTACLANLKGVALAFHMYGADNDQYLPRVQSGSPNVTIDGVSYTVNWFGGQGSSTFSNQVGILKDYFGKADLAGCPSLQESDFPSGATNFREFYGPCDYAYNAIFGALSPGQDGQTMVRKISDIVGPSRKALVWDSCRIVTTSNISRTPFGYPTDRAPSVGKTDPNVHGRHLGKANVSWMDGHAEPFKPYIPDDWSPFATSTFAGSAPSALPAVDKKYNIGVIYDGANPPTFSYPAPPEANRYYDPSY